VHVPTWNSARAYQEAMRSERGVRDQTAPSDHLAWVGPATTPHPRALQSDWLPKRRHSGAAHAAYLHPNLALPLYVVQVRRRSRPRTLRTDLAPLGRYHESRRADCAPYVPHAPPLSHHRSQSGRSARLFLTDAVGRRFERWLASRVQTEPVAASSYGTHRLNSEHVCGDERRARVSCLVACIVACPAGAPATPPVSFVPSRVGATAREAPD
jgi:hypothetical protein